MSAWTDTWDRIADAFGRSLSPEPPAAAAAEYVFQSIRIILTNSTRRQLGQRENEWEDALQTVFQNMIEHADRAPADGVGFRKWVCVIRRHVCQDLLDRKRPEEPLPMTPPRATGTGVVSKVHRRSEHDRLRRRIDALPSPQQDIVRLRFVEGLRMKEIARHLQANTRVVRRHLERALRRLEEPGRGEAMAQEA